MLAHLHILDNTESDLALLRCLATLSSVPSLAEPLMQIGRDQQQIRPRTLVLLVFILYPTLLVSFFKSRVICPKSISIVEMFEGRWHYLLNSFTFSNQGSMNNIVDNKKKMYRRKMQLWLHFAFESTLRFCLDVSSITFCHLYGFSCIFSNYFALNINEGERK